MAKLMTGSFLIFLNFKNINFGLREVRKNVGSGDHYVYTGFNHLSTGNKIIKIIF